MTRRAVIGAGLCGLLVARALQEAGQRVEVFDKGRGPGGRMGTRRWNRADPGAPSFDHGAVCCTPQDRGFREQVDRWVAAGQMVRWNPRTPGLPVERFVAVPTWGALARHLAQPLDLKTQSRVTSIQGEPGAWELRFESSERAGPFEQVLVTVPGPQVALLLAPASPALGAEAAKIRTTRCWAAMLRFSEPLETPFDLVEDAGLDAVVRTAAAEASRPGRPAAPCWTVHAGPRWSSDAWDDDPAEVAGALSAALGDALGIDLPRCEEARAHRWGFAACGAAAGGAGAGSAEAFLEDGLGLAGDGLGAAPSGLEAAWSSAQELIRLVLGPG